MGKPEKAGKTDPNDLSVKEVAAELALIKWKSDRLKARETGLREIFLKKAPMGEAFVSEKFSDGMQIVVKVVQKKGIVLGPDQITELEKDLGSGIYGPPSVSIDQVRKIAGGLNYDLTRFEQPGKPTVEVRKL